MTCKHLKDAQMSYFRHLLHAWSMSAALFIHGIFPWYFENYVSDKINQHKESIDKSN